jgi:hypothetical protein
VKLLLVVRTFAVVVAVACAALSLLAANPLHDRLRRVARFAALAGFGAQLGLVAADAWARKASWWRALLPLVGIAIALRTFAAGAAPPATLLSYVALDLALAAFAAVAVARALRRSPESYPEDVLEREFERFAGGPLCRYVAVELVTFAVAVRFCLGGFRAPLPPGFSYVRGWGDGPLLLVAPLLFVLPEAIALDFALAREPWYWRLASDGLHAYAALWLVGIFATARLRPHRCDGERVRFRFGAIRKLDVPRDAIALVAVHARVTSAKALRAPGTFVMALSGSAAVDVRLRVPLVVPTPFGRTRTIERIVAAADDPHAFAAALAGS